MALDLPIAAAREYNDVQCRGCIGWTIGVCSPAGEQSCTGMLSRRLLGPGVRHVVYLSFLGELPSQKFGIRALVDKSSTGRQLVLP